MAWGLARLFGLSQSGRKRAREEEGDDARERGAADQRAHPRKGSGAAGREPPHLRKAGGEKRVTFKPEGRAARAPAAERPDASGAAQGARRGGRGPAAEQQPAKEPKRERQPASRRQPAAEEHRASARNRQSQQEQEQEQPAVAAADKRPATKRQRGQRVSEEPKQQAEAQADAQRAGTRQQRGAQRGASPARQQRTAQRGASPARQRRRREAGEEEQEGQAAAKPTGRRQERERAKPAAEKPAGRRRQAPAADDEPGPSNRQPEPVVEPPAPSGNEPPKTGGMKRVRSSWKMRPLFIDEKLRVFVEGQGEELMHFDGGEFYQWLKDCETGGSNPEDGFCYPLIVQDQDMRTVLEIKPPELAAKQKDVIGHVAEAAIHVPMIKELPMEEQPDVMLESQPMPTPGSQGGSQRAASEPPPSSGGGQPGVAAAAAAAEQAREKEEGEEEGEGELDPPYVRYLEPTPDDLDLSVEYDVDEEDEEWLEVFNERARKGKSRKARHRLSEEWLERLMDRMEKEYTHALQRNPEKWVVEQPEDGSGSDVPSVTLPPIEEVFSLRDCMAAPGMHHYPAIIEAVYKYWRGKHSRAGSPLIQRLWYEPPWHRKKAAEQLAEDEGAGEGPFRALDAPEVLLNVRRRKLDTEEIRNRFSELRRDLDAARLLADQVRKREKLKKQELRLFQSEWAARMAEVEAGKPIALRNGQLRHPPPPLSGVARVREAGGELELFVGEEQEAGEVMPTAEDRAARLAARRSARDAAAAAGFKKRLHKAPHGGHHTPRKPPAARQQQKRQQPAAPAAAAEDDVSGNTSLRVADDAADATTSRGGRRPPTARPAERQPPKPQLPARTSQKKAPARARGAPAAAPAPPPSLPQPSPKVSHKRGAAAAARAAAAAAAADREQLIRQFMPAHIPHKRGAAAAAREAAEAAADAALAAAAAQAPGGGGQQQTAAPRAQGRGGAGSQKRRRQQEPEDMGPSSSSDGDSEVAHKENKAPPRPPKRSRPDAAAGGGAAAAAAHPAAAVGSGRRSGALAEINGDAPSTSDRAAGAHAPNKRAGAAGGRDAGGRKGGGGAAARPAEPRPRAPHKRGEPRGGSVPREVLALLAAGIHDVKAPEHSQ